MIFIKPQIKNMMRKLILNSGSIAISNSKNINMSEHSVNLKQSFKFMKPVESRRFTQIISISFFFRGREREKEQKRETKEKKKRTVAHNPSKFSYL